MYDNEKAKLSAIDNQSEKVISSLRHGINLLGKISRLGNDEYIFDTVEVNEALEEASINDPAIIRYLKEMISENLIEIRR